MFNKTKDIEKELKKLNVKIIKNFFGIEYIILSQKGIYILSKLNYIGKIRATLNLEKWYCYKGKLEYTYPNQVNLLKKQIELLSKTIKQPTEKIQSYIIYNNKCKIIIKPDNTPRYKIMNQKEFIKDIKKELSSQINKFNQIQISHYENILKGTLKI